MRTSERAPLENHVASLRERSSDEWCGELECGPTLPMSTGVRIASTLGQGVEVRLDVRRLVWSQTAVAALPRKRAVPRPSGKDRLPPSRVDVVLPVVLSEHAARPPLGRKAGRKPPPVGTRGLVHRAGRGSSSSAAASSNASSTPTSVTTTSTARTERSSCDRRTPTPKHRLPNQPRLQRHESDDENCSADSATNTKLRLRSQLCTAPHAQPGARHERVATTSAAFSRSATVNDSFDPYVGVQSGSWRR